MQHLTYQKLNKLTDRVEYCLSKYPETRDSDIDLFARLCERFYPPFERPLYNWRDLAQAMHIVPSMDHIARLRRAVIMRNKYKKYLPTRFSIAEARKINKEVWTDYAVNNPREIYKEPVNNESNIPFGFDDEGNLINDHRKMI